MEKARKELIELANCYFQCVYYLTTSTYGENQALTLSPTEETIPKQLRIENKDFLLIHSAIGTYNLHLIPKEDKFLYGCVLKITRLHEKHSNEIDVVTLLLNELVCSHW